MTPDRGRRAPYIAVGFVILAAAIIAWLVVRSDRDRTPHVEPNLETSRYPTAPTDADRQRAAKRRSLERVGGEPSPPADPLLVALVGEDTKYAMVFEASAILTSSVGAILAGCVGVEDVRIGDFQLGSALDRIALLDDAVVVTGHFGDVASLVAHAPGAKRIGDDGVSVPLDDELVLTMWRGELVVLGTAEVGRRTLDRLTGRSPAGTPLFEPEEAYGDIYGAIDPASFAAVVPAARGALASGIREATAARVHADVHDGIYQVVELDIPAAARETVTAELRAILGDAIRSAETPAVGPFDRGISEVYETVSIETTPNGIEARIYMPLDFVARRTAGCRFGEDGPRPKGYVAPERYEGEGWSAKLPTNVVPFGANGDRILAEWPGAQHIVDIVRDDPATFVDPATLQTVAYHYTAVPTVCERNAKLLAVLAEDPNETITTVAIGGRTWTRQTTTGQYPALSYTYCEGDRLWSLSVAVPWPLTIPTAARRAQELLRKVELR